MSSHLEFYFTLLEIFGENKLWTLTLNHFAIVLRVLLYIYINNPTKVEPWPPSAKGKVDSN